MDRRHHDFVGKAPDTFVDDGLQTGPFLVNHPIGTGSLLERLIHFNLEIKIVRRAVAKKFFPVADRCPHFTAKRLMNNRQQFRHIVQYGLIFIVHVSTTF